MKRNIYFNEYNVPTENSIYLPYSSGLLQAYAQQYQTIVDSYEFQPFLFIRDTTDNILLHYKNPYIACFSVSVWNFRLSLEVAKAVKKRYPSTTIIFGGPHIPSNGQNFFKQYPFVDLLVCGEGERVFTQLLFDSLKMPIKSKKVLKQDNVVKNLDIFPSPYVSGVFDTIMSEHKDIEFKAILETNRGCPFSCSFCFWGNYNTKIKIAFHSINFIKQEAKWIGKNQISYIFCADANFGMFKKDLQIAQIYADTKDKYKFPKKFRVCYGKNSTENIFKTASILSKADLAKTVTLSIQSNDTNVLQVIHRSNIKKSTFTNLQHKYALSNIPTYTEIILGLPLETKDTFINGIQKVLESVINNQIFIYHCQILPNTELADPKYIKKYGIQTVKIPLRETHGSYRPKDLVQEYEESVIATSSMSVQDWKECAVIAWVVQLLHGLKIGYNISTWLNTTYNIKYIDLYTFLAYYKLETFQTLWSIANDITNGKARCQIDSRYGNIYYEPEEITFLNIVYTKKKFYNELYNAIICFLNNKNIKYNKIELNKVVGNQSDQLPNPDDFSSTQELAREIILYGRKSNKLTKNIIKNEI